MNGTEQLSTRTRRAGDRLRGVDDATDRGRGHHEPVVIEVVVQKDIADCGVAALAMLTGKSYGEVMAVVPARTRGDLSKKGISVAQLRKYAKALGCPLRYVKDGDLSNVVGILDLQRYAEEGNPRKGYEGHLAIVAKGVVINPNDGGIWTDIDAFFKTRRWAPLGVLVRQEVRTDKGE